MTTFTPISPAEVLSAVQWAVAEEAPLEVVGHGSKRAIGRPLQTEHTLDVSKLTGVTLYEPAELVLSARAGTPLAEIEKLLAENGQQFAFEPMDYGRLLGEEPGRGTIGSVLAANLSGPRRLKAGAARDHILGIHAVSGRGEAFKSGGRVVKNVTGYDLSKAMAGSWGTLAAFTDVTFKVLPAAETEVTLAVRGLLDDKAAAAMSMALGSSAEVSSAAHLPERIAARVADGALGSEAATLLRVEGFGPSVTYRIGALKDLLRNAGQLLEIKGEASEAIWRDIRDCAPFAGSDKPLWRVSMAPADSHAMVMALRMQSAVEVFYDWQGGLIWLSMEMGEPEDRLVRGAVKHFGGGHATLVRAAPGVRAATPVFEPQPPALAALADRLKAEFDPKQILNPGRMA
ncbi:FAD-binding protein [Mesorhizobium sp. 1M-11]|uniref:FAD-binding protein n=1 Tax=Mesorhizobium sp. 1M-11 TaxID=1529006 RepID=UPI0006C7490F|nr:FAD-binding protein [Mesorhizobium sp. 1M-11]